MRELNDGSNRPDLDLYFMRMARLAATRSTCLRRAVGCVLVDDGGKVLATGYNGVASGERHCNEPFVLRLRRGGDHALVDGEVPRVLMPWDDGYDPNDFVREVKRYYGACSGAYEKSGEGLNTCAAVHAEQNALLQCAEPRRIGTAYVTVSPCDSCLKLFLNTSCRRIVVGGWYGDEAALRARWEVGGRFVNLDERL